MILTPNTFFIVFELHLAIFQHPFISIPLDSSVIVNSYYVITLLTLSNCYTIIVDILNELSTAYGR